jgi:glycosylphosphatidylinositol phospholipase D
MNKMLLNFLITVVLVQVAVNSCGLTVHLESSRMAVELLRSVGSGPEDLALLSLISKHQSALEAGSFFPDWGYSCGNASNASEYAHWPPFYAKAAQFIFQSEQSGTLNCSDSRNFKSDDIKCQRLLAFLLGGISHSVADISWHSLYPHSTGFIKAIAMNDFGGDYELAHDAADFGGVFVYASIVASTGFAVSLSSIICFALIICSYLEVD